MNKLTFILVACMASAGVMTAQVTKTVHVETAGTLSTLLTEEEKATVTELTVTGNIGAADFPVMNALPVIELVDLSGASVENDAIPAYAFTNEDISNRTLREVIVPNTIKTIGEWAFADYLQPFFFTFPTDLETIEKAAFMQNRNLNINRLPEKLKTIGPFAFEVAKVPNEVIIPASVIEIGEVAFAECSGLEKVTILSTNAVTIGTTAFGGTGLKEVTLPATVTSIGNYAFFECAGLTAVYNGSETPLNIHADVFKEIALENVALYVPETSIEAYEAAAVWTDFGTIEAIENVTAIAPVKPGTRLHPYIINNTLIINGLNKTSALTIMDISGRTLLCTTVNADTPVPLNGINKGIYIVNINNKTYKIIKN